jgi:hypothetical protein
VDVEEAVVTITVGATDVTADVIFSQTNFQAVAAAQPGSCTVTLRALYTFSPGRDLIALYINGKRMWWGYLFVFEQGYVFPDKPEPRMVLHGVDLNILFDKLVLYNRFKPTWYPDGSNPKTGLGGYKRQKVTTNGQISGWVVAVPRGTTDKAYITKMLTSFDLDKVSPLIKWGQTVPSDSKIDEVAVINTGDTGATWTPPSAGTTLRAFFTDVSANILRSMPGSSIWYIDPDGYIVYKEQDTDWAPFSVGDNEGSVACKNLTVTTDISRLKNDVIIFTGTLDPTPQSTQEFLLYVHNSLSASILQFGRFQWGEVMGSDWLAGMIRARSNKILYQEGVPAMRAEFTIYKAGLYPGQIVSIFSGVHTFVTFDPTFGLQSQSGVNLPIRAIDMNFPTPTTVEYRITASYDTQDPWGLLLALKRPPARGLVQPNFNVIDRSKYGTTYPYIVASPMVLVKEWATPMSGNKWSLTYAYVRDSLTVVVPLAGTPGGVRLTSVPDPQSAGGAGFIETSPDLGTFQLAKAAPSVYVEYHVWHNLDANAV